MTLDYKTAESTIRPQPMEIIGNTVYLRKNITESERTFIGLPDPVTYYEYQEAWMPLEEFNKNSGAILMQEMIAGNRAQLDIMEGLADLSMMMMGGDM